MTFLEEYEHKRRCPNCLNESGERWIDMEHKFSLNDGPEDGEGPSTSIYQCPKCKNVEAV